MSEMPAHRDGLRVAVNLLWLAPGRVGGSEEYLVRQLAGLIGDPSVTTTLFVQPGFVAAHPAIAASFETISAPLRHDWRLARIAAEHSWLTYRTRNFDVVHHGGGTAPRTRRTAPPALVTVHDLQYRVFPQYFSPARRRYLSVAMPSSVRRAAIVATPSEFVRGTVIDAFGVDPERVRVVPHGVPMIERPTHLEIEGAKAALIGDHRYLVYPAITHPHKRHRMLVDMMSLTDRADHPLREHRLVLLGGHGAVEQEVERAIADSPAADRIIRTGRVDASIRDALIAGADALVFPSEYEGFGAPLVEAMALDVPVVASAHPAVVEVVGSAGVVVEASDPEAWVESVIDALGHRQTLIAAGRARWADFSTAASGSALADAYRLAAGRSGASVKGSGAQRG